MTFTSPPQSPRPTVSLIATIGTDDHATPPVTSRPTIHHSSSSSEVGSNHSAERPTTIVARSLTTPTSASSVLNSPRRRALLSNHPSFVAIRSKSASELDTPELTALASRIHLGAGASSFPSIATHFQHDGTVTPRGSMSMTPSQGDMNNSSSMIGRTPIITEGIKEEAENLENSSSLTPPAVSFANGNGILNNDAADTGALPSSSPLLDTAQISEAPTTQQQQHEPSFRIGIVASDCEDLMNNTSIAAMANPVSKCHLVSVTVLNWKQCPVHLVIKDVTKWIKKHYFSKLLRYGQFVLSDEAKSGNDDKNSIPYPLQYHYNQLMTQPSNDYDDDFNSSDVLDLDESAGVSASNFTFDTDASATVKCIGTNPNLMVEIFVGEEGFQKILLASSPSSLPRQQDEAGNSDQSKEDLEMKNKASSCWVDGLYFIISDSRKQHEYAIASLKAHKHVLIHDLVSTSIVDFCQQISLSIEMNRFIQFSTMFFHQYRVKTFLDCVTSSEAFGRIESIDVILTININDAHKVDVTFPPTTIQDGCIHRLGRFCVLISTLIFNRAAASASRYFFDSGREEEQHKPLTAHVTKYAANTVTKRTTNHMEPVNSESVSSTGDEEVIEIPMSADCVVEFTNNRILTFSVQYSTVAPTRQVLTVRADGRYGTISEFVVPHRDGLSTCRLYDSSHRVISTSPHPGNEFDVVCGEAVDMPSGPPQDVIMWRRFCELSRAIEQEGWGMNDNADGNIVYDNDVVDVGESVGLDVDASSFHESNNSSRAKNKDGTEIPGMEQQFDSFFSAMPTLAALEVQEARDVTDVAIQTKSILKALTKSCTLSSTCDNTGTDNGKSKTGVPVAIDIPEIW